MRQFILKTSFFCVIILLTISIFTSKETFAQESDFQATVKNIINISDIPSASGIIKLKDEIYIIGENSPYLFQINSNYQVTKKIRIFKTKDLQNEEISKEENPDFESMTIVPWGEDKDILIFGSGSIPEKHEIMTRIDFDKDKEEIKSYPLEKFYKHLSKKAENEGLLNIEGAAFWNNNLLLLNRADNILFKIDFNDFEDYMRYDEIDKPEYKAIKFELPELNGITARFSSACILPKEDMLIFTATAESNPNQVNKEDIPGSYMGIIDLDQLDNTKPICKLIEKDNKPFPGKIKSLIILEKNDISIKMIGVMENNNGNSKLVEIEFKNTTK